MRITVISIHPLYDTRIAKHLRLLVDAGCEVTYVNQSAPAGKSGADEPSGVRLVHRPVSAVFRRNVVRYAFSLLWFLSHVIRCRPHVVHIHDLMLLPLALPARLMRSRVVLDVHEYYLRFPGTTGRLARWYYRCFGWCVHGYVGIARDVFPDTPAPRVVVPNYQDRRDYVPVDATKGSDACYQTPDEGTVAHAASAPVSIPSHGKENDRRSGEGNELSNLRNPAVQEGRASGRIAPHPRPLSPGRGEFPNSLSAIEQPVRIIYFGSLCTRDRDVTLLVDLADVVLRQTRRAEFLIGGTLRGPQAETLLQRMDELQKRFPNRFHWRGVMSRSDVLRETATADVGLLFHKPQSHNYRGASPNKIFEYLAVGAAIFATDGFHIAREVAAAGAGRLFPAGVETSAVADELLALIDNPAYLGGMREASRRLGRRYCWQQVAGGYLELYGELGVPVPKRAA